MVKSIRIQLSGSMVYSDLMSYKYVAREQTNPTLMPHEQRWLDQLKEVKRSLSVKTVWFLALRTLHSVDQQYVWNQIIYVQLLTCWSIPDQIFLAIRKE